MGLFKKRIKKGRADEAPDVGNGNADSSVSKYSDPQSIPTMSPREEPRETGSSSREVLGDSTDIPAAESKAGMVLDGLDEITSQTAAEAEAPGLEGISLQDALSDVFESEVVVDEKLKALASRVEEVRAEEVVEELRNLVRSLMIK